MGRSSTSIFVTITYVNYWRQAKLSWNRYLQPTTLQTYLPNLFLTTTTTAFWILWIFSEPFSIHGGVLNAWSWLTIPNTSYLFFIILLSILCILATVCVSSLSYFITILYIFTILCIAYSPLFLPHLTESKSYPLLYFVAYLLSYNYLYLQ